MNTIKYLFVVMLSSVLMTACGTTKKATTNLGSSSFEVQCLGSGADGKLKLRSWANAKTTQQAIDNAKKKAVRDLLFLGIRKGGSECGFAPMLLEVNAAKKHEDYFNRFFADNGAYLMFVELVEDNMTTKKKSQKLAEIKSKINVDSSSGVAHVIDVIVDKTTLKQHLKSERIIK
jgi:hypothetical protein